MMRLGGSLDRYGALPVDILPSVVVCTLNGLLYLWSIKIMHRGTSSKEYNCNYLIDMKPSNVLVNTEGRVKLCDLGVSRELQNTIAQAQTYVGTCVYMAPEKLAGEQYTIQSDIWSFGLTILEVL
jgi:serine/threonine protein kinase